MSIRVECDDCGKKYAFADKFAGRIVPCKACDADIEVPGPDDAFEDDFDESPRRSRERREPRRREERSGRSRGRADRSRGESRSKSASASRRVRAAADDFDDDLSEGNDSKSKIIGIAIGGGVLVLVVVLAIVFALGGDDDEANDDNVAQKTGEPAQDGKVAQNNPVPVNPNPINPNPNPATVIPQPKPAPVTPKPNNPVVQQNPAPKPEGGFQKPAGGGNIAPKPPEKPVLPPAAAPAQWNVTVDPVQPIQVDWAAVRGVPVGTSSPRDLVFAGAGSPYFGYRTDVFKNVWTIMDATTGKSIGVGGTDDRRAGFPKDKSISPNGDYFALLLGDGLLVSQVRENKSLGKLPTGKVGFKGKTTFPNNSSVAFVGEKQVMIWELPSGDPIRTIQLEERPAENSRCFSPGGKYFAIGYDVFAKNGNGKIYETATGNVVAAFAYPGERASCQAMSFSPDGTKFVGYFSDSGKEKIWTWNVADGTSKGFEIKDVFFGSRDYPWMQWFPNSKRFLLKRRHIVDVEAEGVVLKFDKDMSMGLVNDTEALKLEQAGNAYSIVKAPVSKADLNKIAATVSQGGQAIDAELPPLTKANIDQIAKLDANANVPQWEVPIDPAPAGAGDWKSPVKVPQQTKSPGGVFVSHGTGNRAAVFYAPRNSSGEGSLDVVDMTSGQSVGNVKFAYQSACLDFSPSGKLALIRVEKGKDRLDVYAVDDGKHVAGWRPYDEKGRHEREIKSAHIVDDTHVITVSSRDLLRVWEVPACKCLYEIESAGLPVLSPTAKYFVCRSSSSLLAVESISGRALGKVSLGAYYSAAAIHHDGTRIATTYLSGGAATLNVWDVKTGQSVAEFPVRMKDQTLHWCAGDYLLVSNSVLVDSKQKASLWSYTLATGKHSISSPDGRHWFVASGTGANLTSSVVGVTLPQPGVLDKLPADLNNDQMVVKPGSSLSLDTAQLQSPPNNANFTSQVIEKIKTSLAANQQTLAAGQTAFIKLSMSERATGKTLEFRSIGGGFGTTSVAEMVVDCVAAVVVQGKTVWQTKMSPSGGTFIIRRKQGQSIEDHLRESRWKSAEQFFMGLRFPAYIFKDGAGYGYGKSVFTDRGVAPAAGG